MCGMWVTQMLPSPRLLVLQGRHKEAQEVLAKLRGWQAVNIDSKSQTEGITEAVKLDANRKVAKSKPATKTTKKPHSPQFLAIIQDTFDLSFPHVDYKLSANDQLVKLQHIKQHSDKIQTVRASYWKEVFRASDRSNNSDQENDLGNEMGKDLSIISNGCFKVYIQEALSSASTRDSPTLDFC
ncbi:hypothetical protein BJ165DRAFT_1401503 [Panaeolus papilionaceus]|nr:hypothetical protein BJ165DRAFT_1401503 [Panaeolus papilionaceus]